MLCDDDTDRVCVRERLPFIPPPFFLGEKNRHETGKEREREAVAFLHLSSSLGVENRLMPPPPPPPPPPPSGAP